MTHTFKLSRRTARLRAGALALLLAVVGACDGADRLAPATEAPTAAPDLDLPTPDTPSADGVIADDTTMSVDMIDGPSLATTSYRGGMPFGHFHLPNTLFGSLYDGAVRNIWPPYLVSNLATIKARGGRVMVSFTGSQANVRDAYGNFSFSKWKSLVDRYRSINFSSYVSDGTIIGHYLIDEPSDKNDWNGKQIPPATVEAMAKYSKSIWPNMVTIVRDWPTYMDNYTGTYYYLDAAWAQYRVSKGAVSTVLANEVSAAKAKGLALIIGLNVLKGGYDGGKMTPTQIKSWGGTMLGSSYPCAFVSWEYNSDYLTRSDVKSAMYYLRDKAKSRSFKSCRGA